MQTGKIIVLTVKQSDTILRVKDKIHAAEGIPPDSHKLMYNKTEILDDSCTLSDYEVRESSTIYSAPDGVKGNTKLFSI
jgi:ubiquitin